MNEINKKELKTKDKIKSINVIYLIIIILYFSVVAIVFYHSTNFIVKNINKVFFNNQVSEIQALDKSKYSILEKKLGLVDQSQDLNNLITVQNTTELQKVIEPTPTIIQEPDKTILTISIINAAKKAGVASSLSKILESAGYNKATTSDAKKISTKTTISIKDSKKDYSQSIIDLVKKTHPNIVTKVNKESSKFDVIITVGK